jgi:hypothetical protein
MVGGKETHVKVTILDLKILRMIWHRYIFLTHCAFVDGVTVIFAVLCSFVVFVGVYCLAFVSVDVYVSSSQ